MSWRFRIDLKEVWKSENAIDISKEIINQLSAINLISYPDERRKIDLVENFQSFVASGENDEDAFDEIFEALYDLADEQRIWIATEF